MKKIEYKLLNEQQYDDTTGLLDTLLTVRGVENINALLNVCKEDCHHFSKFDRMDEAVKCFDYHIKNGSKILVIPDEDVDGYTSTSLIWNYIKEAFDYECDYAIHEKKVHGIKLKELKDKEFDLLIIPDAGTSDVKELKKLMKDNPKLDIIILDHHKPELNKKETIKAFIKRNPAIVINPQTCDYPNKTLAGVGVVYKFCQALDDFYSFNLADNYLDLVALGQVADSTDLRDLETRYLSLQGIKILDEDKKLAELGLPTKGNKFVRAIVETKKKRDLKIIDFISIGWKIAPIINAVTRVGTLEEKTTMFKAFIEVDEDVMYQPRRKVKTDPKPEPIKLSLQTNFVRLATNIKGRQDRSVKKAKEKLNEQIITNNLVGDNKILIVNGMDDIDDKGLTGLIAGKLSDEYQLPTVVLRKKDDETYGGSCRNFRMSPIKSLREVINNTGIAKGLGHDNASGFQTKMDNLNKFKLMMNEALKDVEMNQVYWVDFAIPVGRLKKQDVMKVGGYSKIWGNTLPTPQFAITNITMDVEDIELIGDRKNMLKFKKGDHSFIKFYSNRDELDKIKCRKREGFGKNPRQVSITAICEFEINEFHGIEYPSIIIKDYDSFPKEEILF